MSRSSSLAGARHAAQPIERSAPERIQTRAPERGTERHDERRLSRPSNRNMTDDGRFSLDMSRVPPGYVMEFKRHEVMGMRDRRNQVMIREYHWEPVPHKMQPQFLGHLCNNDDEHIVVDGLGLYMRPEYLNEEAAAEGRSETDYQLQQQLQSLRLSSKEQVGNMRTFVKKQTVQVQQPVE